MAPTFRLPKDKANWRLNTIRYGVGAVTTLVGIVLLITNPGGFGVDGFALGGGAGLSVILFNVLFRMGIEGDKERDAEQDARRFLAEHGRWPDEDESRTRPRHVGTAH